MSNMFGAQPPGWFRIVALLALVWNLIGVYFYLASVGVVPAPDPAMVAASAAAPAWVTAAFAICVFGGALGSLGLWLRARWSKPILLLSLLAILAQDIYVFLLRPEGPTDRVMPVLVTLIGVLLVWLAYRADRRGWLR